MVRRIKTPHIVLPISLLLMLSAAAIRTAQSQPFAPVVDLEAYRLTHPIAAPYWSPAFVLEYRYIDKDLTERGYWQMSDVAAPDYHVSHGQRLVAGAPTHAPHTLWLFGNSGLFDPWLPDNLTAASVLQGLLGPSWCVINQSSLAQAAQGETLWLKDTQIRRGDLVIFVDGAQNQPDATAFNRAISDARTYATAHGAGFRHFLQPYIYRLSYDGMDGVRLDVPEAGFVESAHMNERGAALEAKEIYDALTIF